jgi:hypothetical protein
VSVMYVSRSLASGPLTTVRGIFCFVHAWDERFQICSDRPDIPEQNLIPRSGVVQDILIKDPFTDLCGHRLLQNVFINTFCEIMLWVSVGAGAVQSCVGESHLKSGAGEPHS